MLENITRIFGREDQYYAIYITGKFKVISYSSTRRRLPIEPNDKTNKKMYIL